MEYYDVDVGTNDLKHIWDYSYLTESVSVFFDL